MRNKPPYLIPIWLSAVFSLLLASCGTEQRPGFEAAASEPLHVASFTVTPDTVDMFLYAVGTVEPIARAMPATRVSGRITTIAADRGDRVTAGQLLVEVDSEDLQRAIEGAVASRERAQASWRMATADFARAESLHADDAIAQQSLDHARTAKDEATAALTVADRTVAEVRARLTYGKVRAPFNGVLTDRRVEVGDLAVPGQPLIALERTDSVKVTAVIAESDAGEITRGRLAWVEAGGRTWQGRVTSVVPASHGTRTYEVRIVVDNGDSQLHSGQFARARFRVGERRVLFVNQDLVIQQGQLRGVYVLTDGHALLRWLRLGDRWNDNIEVLSGLQEGETLLSPVAGIHDGVIIAAAQAD